MYPPRAYCVVCWRLNRLGAKNQGNPRNRESHGGRGGKLVLCTPKKLR